MGYSLVAELFPAILLALPERPKVSGAAAMAGIVAGEATVAWITITGATLAKTFPTWPAVITDLNVGIVALIVNVAVLALVTAFSPRRPALRLAAAALLAAALVGAAPPHATPPPFRAGVGARGIARGFASPVGVRSR